MFFKHFNIKNQLPGLCLSGILVENGLISERKPFRMNKDFEVESKYVKLCREFRGFMRCMMVTFCRRPDFQIFLMRIFFKRLGKLFVSKPGLAFQIFDRAFEVFRENQKVV